MRIYSISIVFLLSLFLSFLVAFFDVIFAIEMIDIQDRVNYLARLDQIPFYFQQVESQPAILILRNEPLFSLLLYSFHAIGLSSLASLRVMLLISSFITFYALLDKGRVPFYALLAILFFDWFIGNYTINIRQGIATSIFLYAFLYLRGKKQLFFYALTPFIHYSFFIVNGLLFFERYLKKKKIATDITVLISASTGLIFGIVILVIAQFIGFGDLALRYSQFGNWLSISLGPVFFLIILVIFIMQGHTFRVNNSFSIFVLSFYITSVLFFPPISRVLICTISLIIISGFSIQSYYRYFFILFLFGYIVTFNMSGKLLEALLLSV
jgi:hypothetical protein